MYIQTRKVTQWLILVYVFIGTLPYTTTSRAQHLAYRKYVQQFLVTNVSSWLYNPIVINSIKSQNTRHKSLAQGDIDYLDKQWRAEYKAKNQSLIDSVLSSNLSTYLKDIKEKSQGLFSEILIMDDRGLNAGQSDITSDYWQGDEDKWQKTYLVGTDALLLGDREYDESSKKFLIQINVPVLDPDNQQPIGAATIGVSLVKLIRQTTLVSQTR